MNWQRAPFQLPERDDEGKLVSAVVVQLGEPPEVQVIGRLEFVQWIEDEEDPDSGLRTPLFNVRMENSGTAYSFADINRWRFVETGTH